MSKKLWDAQKQLFGTFNNTGKQAHWYRSQPDLLSTGDRSGCNCYQFGIRGRRPTCLYLFKPIKIVLGGATDRI